MPPIPQHLKTKFKKQSRESETKKQIVLCIACGGRGRNSNNRPCVPCRGNGTKQPSVNR